MKMAKFKQSVLEAIGSDYVLFTKVGEAMNVRPVSLPKILQRNGNNLNQYAIVTLVAKYMGKDPNELVEETETKKDFVTEK